MFSVVCIPRFFPHCEARGCGRRAGSGGGRVGGVVAGPRPPQSRACAIDALGSSPDRFAQGVDTLDPQVKE